MLEILWGLKTEAMFDVWSFEHVIAGASLGALVALKNKKMFAGLYTYLHQHIPDKSKIGIIRHKYEIVVVALISYIWESIEFYGEIGEWGIVAQRWFYGIEFWPNRVLVDPLLVVLGYLLSQKYPVLIWPTRIISVVWLYFHIFVFPHSMYLHELYF